jgi:hypothetical protein
LDISEHEAGTRLKHFISRTGPAKVRRDTDLAQWHVEGATRGWNTMVQWPAAHGPGAEQDEDEEWIECSTCLEDLRSAPGPIRQCANGHLQCSRCFTALGGADGACPSCGETMGSIRNRLAENLRDLFQAGQQASGPGRAHKLGLKYGSETAEPEPHRQDDRLSKSVAHTLHPSQPKPNTASVAEEVGEADRKAVFLPRVCE